MGMSHNKRREREKEKGERKRERSMQGGIREERGQSRGCRGSVGKMTQLVELRNI